MATEVIEGTLEEIREIVSLDAIEAGLPRKGIPVGSGPHAAISEILGEGWTLRRVEEVSSETQGVFELDVEPELEALPAKLAAKGNMVASAKVGAKLAAKKTKEVKVKNQTFSSAFSGEFDAVVR